MNKLIRPMSEDFLYCSPESPEKSDYRIFDPLAAPKTTLAEDPAKGVETSCAKKIV